MRILLIVILIATFASCKKSKPAVSANLIGKWEWEYSNNLNGDTVRPTTSAIVDLALLQDSTYTLSLNSTEVASGIFSTSTEASSGTTFIMLSNSLNTDNLFVGTIKAYTLTSLYLTFYDKMSFDDFAISKMRFKKTL